MTKRDFIIEGIGSAILAATVATAVMLGSAKADTGPYCGGVLQPSVYGDLVCVGAQYGGGSANPASTVKGSFQTPARVTSVAPPSNDDGCGDKGSKGKHGGEGRGSRHGSGHSNGRD